MEKEILEDVVEVLNIINGRRLWAISEGMLSSFALAKATSSPSVNGATTVNGDIKREFLEENYVEELEKALMQASEAITKGKELLTLMRKQKVEEAFNALIRVASSDVVKEVIKKFT